MKQITFQVWKCTRCQHQWVPRITSIPKRCPNCKSPYWQTTPRTKTATGGTAKRKGGTR